MLDKNIKKHVFGITGIPASGKTTAAKMFVKRGMELVDVDKAGKWAVDNNSNVQLEIKKAFGEELFNNGALERKKLAAIVFADTFALKKLNAIVHPVLLSRVDFLIKVFLANSSLPFILLDAALLFELSLDKKCEKTLVVWSDIERCLQRSMERDGITRKQAEERIKSQMAQDEKKRRANILIENNGPLQFLEKRVDNIYKDLC